MAIGLFEFSLDNSKRDIYIFCFLNQYLLTICQASTDYD